MTGLGPRATDHLAWRTPMEAALLIGRGRTMRPAARIALIVGTLLTLVNQADVIMSGGVDGTTGIRVAANYAIPYVVSSIGFLASYRVAGDPGPRSG